MDKTLELIFAATQNYLPYYTVLARSVAANANGRADVWWKYARQTSFYENFISGIVYETINDLINKHLCQESKLHRLFRQIKTFKC